MWLLAHHTTCRVKPPTVTLPLIYTCNCHLYGQYLDAAASRALLGSYLTVPPLHKLVNRQANGTQARPSVWHARGLPCLTAEGPHSGLSGSSIPCAGLRAQQH